ncbi:hypothetical protein D3C71_1026970 [compost metagenome]
MLFQFSAQGLFYRRHFALTGHKSFTAANACQHRTAQSRRIMEIAVHHPVHFFRRNTRPHHKHQPECSSRQFFSHLIHSKDPAYPVTHRHNKCISLKYSRFQSAGIPFQVFRNTFQCFLVIPTQLLQISALLHQGGGHRRGRYRRHILILSRLHRGQ